MISVASRARRASFARNLAFIGCAAALAGCAGAPQRPQPLPPRPVVEPDFRSGPFQLGDAQRLGPEALASRWERILARRFDPGAPLASISEDLRANGFDCLAPMPGKGAPPALACRKSVVDAECTHTWQAHIFADAGGLRLARARPLYDRACGPPIERLLGAAG